MKVWNEPLPTRKELRRGCPAQYQNQRFFIPDTGFTVEDSTKITPVSVFEHLLPMNEQNHEIPGHQTLPNSL